MLQFWTAVRFAENNALAGVSTLGGRHFFYDGDNPNSPRTLTLFTRQLLGACFYVLHEQQQYGPKRIRDCSAHASEGIDV